MRLPCRLIGEEDLEPAEGEGAAGVGIRPLCVYCGRSRRGAAAVSGAASGSRAAGRMLSKRANAVAESLAELTGRTADEVHREWVGEGGMPPEIATRGDLERKLAWMEHLISDKVDSEGHKIEDRFLTLNELRDGLGRATG